MDQPNLYQTPVANEEAEAAAGEVDSLTEVDPLTNEALSPEEALKELPASSNETADPITGEDLSPAEEVLPNEPPEEPPPPLLPDIAPTEGDSDPVTGKNYRQQNKQVVSDEDIPTCLGNEY